MLDSLHPEIKRTDIEQKNSIEIPTEITSENLPEVIEASREFCNQLKIDSGSWEGVSFQTERMDQIDESMKQITRFSKELHELDERSWDKFTTTLLVGKVKDYRQIEWLIFQSIEAGADWVVKASVELDDFFDFVGRKKLFRFLQMTHKSFKSFVNLWKNTLAREIIRHILEGSILPFQMDLMGMLRPALWQKRRTWPCDIFLTYVLSIYS